MDSYALLVIIKGCLHTNLPTTTKVYTCMYDSIVTYKKCFYFGRTTRVARWCFFKPKIQIWVYFGGSWNAKCWFILFPFRILYGIWNIVRPFGILYSHLVYFIYGLFGTFCSSLVHFVAVWCIFLVLVW
jgi:hypothetical protein